MIVQKTSFRLAMWLAIFLWLIAIPKAEAQTELLHLNFEDELTGEDGEIPTFYDINFPITYQYGLEGKAAFFPQNNQVFYGEANINELEGSMAYWIKPNWNGNHNEHRIFKYGDTGGMLFGTDGGGYYVSLLNVGMGSGELYANFNTSSWTDDQWYYVVHTWNKYAPTNEEALKVYVNGVKLAQNDPARDKNNIHTISDNAFQIGGTGGSSSLESYLDSYIIFDYQLTDQQVADLYNNMGIPDDLVLEFENDLTGFSGETPSYYDQAYPITYPTGTFGHGGHFPENNQLRYTSNENINDLIGTYATWVNPDWNGSDNETHTFFYYGTTNGMLIEKSASNQLRCIINRGAGANELVATYDVGNWNMSEWHHIACTWNGMATTNQEALMLYVDGMLVAQNSSGVSASNIHTISDSEFQIGGESNTNSLSGTFDRLIIRDEALSADAIFTLYNDYVPPVVFSELYLEFENHLNGACGETPSAYNNTYPITYSSGKTGQAAYFPSSNTLKYPSNGNISELKGSLSYFIKPVWGGNATNHTILKYGEDGGVQIGTNGSGILETIFNFNGSQPLVASYDVSDWNDNQWIHVVHTWNNEAANAAEAVQMYINGVLVAQNTGADPSHLTAVTASEFQVGGNESSQSLEAYLDRFIILDYPVTPENAADLANEYVPVINNMVLESGLSYTFFGGPYNIPDTEEDGVIKIINGTNILLNGNNIKASGQSFSGYFIHMEDANAIQISGFDTISSYFYAIKASNCQEISISNNNLSNNKIDQIGWIHIWHDIDNALGGGVLLSESRKVELFDNTMQFQNDGVAMYSCDSIDAYNNNLSWNTGYGIRMFHTDSSRVVNNDCSHADRETDPSDCAAILLFFSRENYVEGNDFSYGGDGIFTNENKTMTNAIPNFPPSNNYFANNDCSWSPHNAIESVFTDGNVFENNICNYSHYGLWLGYSNNITVINNHIANNKASGIAIDRGFDNVITNNVISGNTTGVEMWEGGSSGLPGYTTQTSHDYLIDQNTFRDNAKAISAINTEHTLAYNNTFEYNYTDIYLEDDASADTISENSFGNAVSSYINNQSSDNIFAKNNYMPENISLIECKIIDHQDDATLGLVDYTPFFPSPISFEIVAPSDLAEESNSYWTVFVEDGLPTTLSWDNNDYQVGEASLYINTEGGFDVIPHYWPSESRMADWTLMESDTLSFWIKTENPHSGRFQEFYVQLGNNCGDYYRYTGSLSMVNASIGNWIKLEMPLAGGDGWTRTSSGNISLESIAYLEINVDTWDWGFELWLDGISFTNHAGVGVDETSTAQPLVSDIYPNPFNNNTVIDLYMPSGTMTSMNLYDTFGRQVRLIHQGYTSYGYHQFEINGNELPTGVYYLILQYNGNKIVKKVIKL